VGDQAHRAPHLIWIKVRRRRAAKVKVPRHDRPRRTPRSKA